MVVSLIILYVLALVWVVLHSRQQGRASATDRVLAFVWWNTIGALIAWLVTVWWFIRAFVGTFVGLAWDNEPISPSSASGSRAIEWFMAPFKQQAFALFGRGDDGFYLQP